MRRLTNDVRSALKYRNWYSALALALTLPDICGRIAYPALRSGARYARWFEENMGGYYRTEIHGNPVVFLTGNDCYALRCAYLHVGDDVITEQKARESLQKFFFTTMSAHRMMVNDTHLTLNVRRFCLEVCEAVEAWATQVASDPRAVAEMEGLLVIHTEPFSPGPGVCLINIATSGECRSLDDS